jgi:coenzyme PQQ synthesis protein D (PqqD)
MLHVPTARRDGLIVRELEDETLVYDQQINKAHCLNQTAALVWKHCDGGKTVEEIATLLRGELQAEVDEQIVWLALFELRKRRLLTEKIPGVTRARSGPPISRREMAHKVAQAMVIALPLITTIAAPAPASAASCDPNCGMPPTLICCPTGCPCTGGALCCSGQCSAGSCT